MILGGFLFDDRNQEYRRRGEVISRDPLEARCSRVSEISEEKVAKFYRDNDKNDPRNGAANRYCADLIRNAETKLNWAKHKLANSE